MQDIAWWINDSLIMTQLTGKTQIWTINSNVKIVAKDDQQRKIIKVSDTADIWYIDQQHLIFNQNDTSVVWKAYPSVSKLQVTDSLIIWQIGESYRLNHQGDSVALWMFEKGKSGGRWNAMAFRSSPTDKRRDWARLYFADDSLRVLIIDDDLSFWTPDNDSRILQIDDTTKLWIFRPPPENPVKKKISNWKLTGVGSMNFSQGYYENWAKGGDNNIAALGMLKVEAAYAKMKTKWGSYLDYKLGFLKSEKADNDFLKNEDKFDLNTKIGYRAVRNLYYSFSANLKTQFFKGFKNPGDSLWVSNFFSPAYVTLGLGIDYNPGPGFSFFLSPITHKTTLVLDSVVSETQYGLELGKNVRNETGGYLLTKLNVDLSKELRFENKLDLFSNYSDHPERVDVNWEMALDMKVNKYITANISTHLIWDYDTKFKETNDLGVEEETEKVQFKELISIGLSYKF